MNEKLKTAIDKYLNHKPIVEMTAEEYQEHKHKYLNIVYMLGKEHDKI